MEPSASNAAPPTLLVVDDDAAFRRTLSAALAKRGFDVVEASDPVDARAKAEAQTFEYALVDMRMPGPPSSDAQQNKREAPSGLTLIGWLRAIDDGTRIVVLTGYGSIANAVEALRAGAVDYLTKPTDATQCERALLGQPSATTDKAEPVPSLERVEWEHLQRVLSDCQGNISDAARKLRMHRRSLQRKLSRTPPRG
ncbi:MAG: response regulator [Polyangiaceae bacterium]